MFPGSNQADGNCPSCHQMRYWMLSLVLSPGKALLGEVDRCLTGPRGMTHVTGKPLDYKKKKKKKKKKIRRRGKQGVKKKLRELRNKGQHKHTHIHTYWLEMETYGRLLGPFVCFGSRVSDLNPSVLFFYIYKIKFFFSVFGLSH